MTNPSHGGAVTTLQFSPENTQEFGDLLLLYLEQLGVEFVFGVPGGAIEPLYNALARSERRGGLRAIVARHESGAAFMAHGYHANSGKLGVCCSTTGPGATNLITGVASAYENSVPMLVITAQTSLNKFGRGALQESSDTAVHTVGMFEHCTNYNSLISHPDQFERKLAAALMQAVYTQTPSHISVPLDVLRHPADQPEPSYHIVNALEKAALTDEKAVDRLLTMLTEAKKSILVIGDACADSVGSVLSVASLLKITVLTPPHGKGVVSAYHPLYKGVIGYAGHEEAMDALTDPDVDLIVAVGTGLSERISDGRDIHKLIGHKLVHVEEREYMFVRSPMAKLHIRGNIKTVFSRLMERLCQSDKVRQMYTGSALHGQNPAIKLPDSVGAMKRHFRLIDEIKCNSNAVPIKPQRLMTELPKIFPPSTIYLADPGASMCWAIHYLHPYDRRFEGDRNIQTSLFQACMEFSSMGWSIGAAIGTALAKPNNPVVCIVGDGSWLMSGQEITVARQHNLLIIFVILNDRALGLVKHGQRLAKAEPIGFELPDVDYCEYAKTVGATGYRVDSPTDLIDLDINSMLANRAPCIIDIRIDPDEIPPMGSRVTALQTSQNV